MKLLFILFILVMGIHSLPTEFNLPVRSDTQQKLALALQKLNDELQYFRTPLQNKTNLYKRVALTQQYLQELTSQVCKYDNLIEGEQNKIDGSKNIIVGSYNTLRGNNNYVFIEKYEGQANGDLLIGKWRIQIEKKKLILINSSSAISFINQETNKKYLRYLTENRKFSFGSSGGENRVTVLRDSQDSSVNSFNQAVNKSDLKKVGDQNSKNDQQINSSISQVLWNGNLPQNQNSKFSSRSQNNINQSPITIQSANQLFQSTGSQQKTQNQGTMIMSQPYQTQNTPTIPTTNQKGSQDVFINSNRLQSQKTPNNNLRFETRTQQAELKTPLGFRSNNPTQQSSITLNNKPQSKITTTIPSVSNQLPMNLASWRNRS